jgi:hypothetical protein
MSSLSTTFTSSLNLKIIALIQDVIIKKDACFIPVYEDITNDLLSNINPNNPIPIIGVDKPSHYKIIRDFITTNLLPYLKKTKTNIDDSLYYQLKELEKTLGNHTYKNFCALFLTYYNDKIVK